MDIAVASPMAMILGWWLVGRNTALGGWLGTYGELGGYTAYECSRCLLFLDVDHLHSSLFFHRNLQQRL